MSDLPAGLRLACAATGATPFVQCPPGRHIRWHGYTWRPYLHRALAAAGRTPHGPNRVAHRIGQAMHVCEGTRAHTPIGACRTVRYKEAIRLCSLVWAEWQQWGHGERASTRASCVRSLTSFSLQRIPLHTA